MHVVEIAIAILVGYIILLLLLEAVIWKVQPGMENGVTLFVTVDSTIVARKLYGFQFDGDLYVSSNHWFRKWYYAVMANPLVEVEHDGETKPCTAVPVEGDERGRVANGYKMGFVLRLMCGFAPRRFLRLDPRRI